DAQRRSTTAVSTRFARYRALAGERNALRQNGGGLARQHGRKEKRVAPAARRNLRRNRSPQAVVALARLFHRLRRAVGFRLRRRMARFPLPPRVELLASLGNNSGKLYPTIGICRMSHFP